MTLVTIENRIPRQDTWLGLVTARGVSCMSTPGTLTDALDAMIERRRGPPSAEDERIRGAARDILRNGRYKPTGRGKPASEYLLRAAVEGTFPRIHGPVDANNLLSLEHGVPISLWDTDLAPSREVEFRLGRADESYVFNAAGQVLDLHDLVVGCAVRDGTSMPMVTPIKDSLATKLRPDSRNLAGAIYWPAAAGDEPRLLEVTRAFAAWLARCGDDVTTVVAIAGPGGSARLGGV